MSGPQITPFNCQTESFVLPDASKLGVALDANCTVAAKILYMYQSTGGGALKSMPNTAALSADVATTITSAGASVPFVVRVETGTTRQGHSQKAG